MHLILLRGEVTPLAEDHLGVDDVEHAEEETRRDVRPEVDPGIEEAERGAGDDQGPLRGVISSMSIKRVHQMQKVAGKTKQSPLLHPRLVLHPSSLDCLTEKWQPLR